MDKIKIENKNSEKVTEFSLTPSNNSRVVFGNCAKNVLVNKQNQFST